MRKKAVEGGVYVLKFSKKTVKIGMGKNVEKRLKQYRGYHRYGEDYERLLVIKSRRWKELEKKIHKFIGKRYRRIGRLEIFVCRDQKKLVKQICKEFRSERELVEEIQV